jgi:3-oxoacyl-[acyl-carrier-protein] synthase III
MIRASHPQTVGIHAIAVHKPPWTLANDWFADILPRKFVHHTGIVSRHISLEDEVTLGVRAVEQLRREVDCDLRYCAGLVFVSPSLLHQAVAREYFGPQNSWRESPRRAAQQLLRRLGIATEQYYGINWGCSGYSKAMSIIRRQILPTTILRPHEFLLLVTASRISRITDYGCKQTAPLFGDMATATMLTRSDSKELPAHFDLLYAGAEMQPTSGVYFKYRMQEEVVVPTPEGGRRVVPQRLVFSLDGMGIGDVAPRAMAGATAQALQSTGTRPEQVQFLVPHQAGTGIVRLTAMKLEELGVRGEIINGLTAEVGNVSSCSVAYGLRQTWDRLHGLVACPTAGVGVPGDAKVSQGCVLLQATAAHAN